jgi:2-haloacid dehalogenase
MTRPVLLFDVNETLLDLGALDPLFESAFGDRSVRQEWFLTLQTAWMSATLINHYQPLDVLARAVLEMTAARRGRRLAASDIDAILHGLTHLPPHADVPDALEQLATSGVRLAALTNGTPTGVRTQLAHAKIAGFFERVFSVDAVRRYKPAPEPYRYAAQELGVARKSVDMVAAHAWDLAGARAAGLFTIFVARPGHAWNPANAPADIEVTSIGELARNIAARRVRTTQR